MTTTQWFLAAAACLMGLIVCTAAINSTSNPARTGQGTTLPAAQQGLGESAVGWKLNPGPYNVALRDLTLQDSTRGKELHIRVYVPTPKANVRLSESSLPLVVFSHGAGGSREVGTELLRHWASHGYVVLAPTHADSIALQRQAGGRPDMNQTIASLGLPANRANRVGDCSFMLDSVGEIERRIPELAGRLDLTRVGIAGHSAGAMTTMLATGAQQRRGGDLSDPRFHCAVVLSGQGVGRGSTFTPTSWDDWPVPALVVTGSLDSSSRTGQTAQSRREPFERTAASGNKYLLWIEGATHQSFTGKLRGGELPEAVHQRVNEYLDPGGNTTEMAQAYDQTAIFEVVQCASLAFLDAQLKADAAAQAWLKGAGPQQLMAGVEWQAK